MNSIRILYSEYAEIDIYNIDKTGLYWRRAPGSGLSIILRRGIKKDKSRISIAVYTNCTGSDRLLLWVISYTKTPRALRGINILALGCKWSYSKKA